MTSRLYRPPRRWPALVAVGIAGAVAGTAVTAGAMLATGQRAESAPAAAASVPSPAAQPTTKADRQTCQGWDAAGKLINEAAEELSVIPDGTTILDPSVRDDPAKSGAVQHAADLFGNASKALDTAITLGATPVLAETARTTAASLQALATTYRTFDEASGDAITVARTTAQSMSALCKRLVP